MSERVPTSKEELPKFFNPGLDFRQWAGEQLLRVRGLFERAGDVFADLSEHVPASANNPRANALVTTPTIEDQVEQVFSQVG